MTLLMQLFSRIFNYLLPFVMTMFCGRLGNSVMAGYGLASAVSLLLKVNVLTFREKKMFSKTK